MRWLWGLVWGILRQRCPRCRQGRMFHGALAMNDPCPVCGLLFRREEGSFLGAMYFSYLIGVVILVPLFYLASALLPEWDGVAIAGLVLVPYVFLVPMVFRYSRVLWVYLDHGASPGEPCAGAYEKMRRHQLEETPQAAALPPKR